MRAETLRWRAGTLSPSSVDVQALHWGSPLVEDWQALADQTGAPYFRRPEWVRAWHEIYEPRAALFVLTCRGDDGALVGLLCLARRRVRVPALGRLPVNVMQQAGAGPGAADHCGPLATDVEVERRLFQAARDLGAVLQAQTETVVLRGQLSNARGVRRREVPFLALGGEDVVGTWRRNFRQDTRRRMRRLAESGLTFAWLDPSDPGFGEGVDLLAELHARRWALRGQSGLLDGQRKQALRRAAELATPGCGPRLLQARTGDRVVGSLVTFFDPVSSNYYQLGWDPAFTRLSLGRLLIVEAIEHAQRNDRQRFDFLRGGEDYKYDMGAETMINVDLVVGRTPGTFLELGLASVRKHKAFRRAPA